MAEYHYSLRHKQTNSGPESPLPIPAWATCLLIFGMFVGGSFLGLAVGVKGGGKDKVVAELKADPVKPPKWHVVEYDERQIAQREYYTWRLSFDDIGYVSMRDDNDETHTIVFDSHSGRIVATRLTAKRQQDWIKHQQSMRDDPPPMDGSSSL